MSPTIISGLGCLFLFVYFYYRNRRVNRNKPPGPKPLPLIGNLFDIPPHRPWVKYKEWGDEYKSELVSFSTLGFTTIIVNSLPVAHDIFVKRGQNFSDRPRLPMLTEVLGISFMFSVMPYGDLWKEHRKMFRQEIEYSQVALYLPHALKAARRLTRSVIERPSDFTGHVRHTVASVILSTAYGLDIKPANDPYAELVAKAMDGLSKARTAGVYLVDILPFLRHLPVEHLPGVLGQWKRDGIEWRGHLAAMRHEPFRYSAEKYDNGDLGSCVASRVLQQIKEECKDEDRVQRTGVLRDVLCMAYSAGGDTTISAMLSFIHAMLVNPEAQRKAQEEIDAIVGRDRLVTFDDLGSLHYVHAVVKEVLRWQPAAPLAIPHSAHEDTFYRGYFIPKGALVIGNAWAMTRDESVFGPMVETFRPERFLKRIEVIGPEGEAHIKEVLNPAIPYPSMAFGFGRRICPGRQLAYSTLWIGVATMLQVVSIVKVKNENGEEVMPEVEYKSGLVSCPEEFPCSFEVRSKESQELLEQLYLENDA